MASPFKVFRKNQKKMLAILTILTVFSFTFGYIVLDMIGSRGSGVAFQKAFTSKYGSMTERELSVLRERHNKVISVLAGILTRMGANQQKAQRSLENSFGGSTDEDLAASWLLVQKAKELGMIGDDQAINDYLKLLTEDKVTAGQLKEVFRSAGVSDRMFFELMRDELLALKMKESFKPSLSAVTPSEWWDYFCRVFKKASIEAVPVPVENYLDQIKDPGDEVLKPFFAKYREELPSPYSPEPGFKKPQRIAAEFLKADMEKFASPEAVSDEEVMKVYEENKDYLKQVYPPLTPEKSAEESKSGLPPLEAPADEKPVETPKAEDKQPEQDAPKPEQPEKPAGVEQPKTSAASDRSPFILASIQQQPEEPKADKLPELPKDAEAVTEQPKSVVEPTAEQPANAEEKPAEPAEKETPQLGTADQLRKIIRQQIAMKKLGEIFEKIGKEVSLYRDLKNDYDYSSPAEREGKTPPVKPDFEAIARQYGFTFGSTGMVNKTQAAETELGLVYIQQDLTATQALFQAMGKLRPQSGFDAFGQHEYLFWKSDETKEETLKFEDEGVREMVLREWKMREARSLAKAEADKLAKEAGEAGKPLAEVFADMAKWHVVTPPDFSWMSIGNVYPPSSPKISAVEGVEKAGSEFMDTVFGLEPGTVGSAMNAPQTVAYVVRVKDFSPSYDERWGQFQKTNFRLLWPIAQDEFKLKSRVWLDDLKKQAGFKWTAEHEKLKIRDEQE